MGIYATHAIDWKGIIATWKGDQIQSNIRQADDSVGQSIAYNIKLQFKEEKLQYVKKKNGFNDFDNKVTQYLWNCIAYLVYD